MDQQKMRTVAEYDPDLEVRSPVPDYMAGHTKITQHDLQGCGAAAQNLCLAHAVPKHLVAATGALMDLQTGYKRHVGTARAKGMGEMVASVGLNRIFGDTSTLTRFFLLIDVRTRPEVQYYVPVVWEGMDTSGSPHALVFPIVAHLQTGPPRMTTLGLPVETVTVMAGGEIALMLLKIKKEWSLHPATFEWCPGPSLLALRLTGIGHAFELPKRRRQRPPRFDGAELLEQDPWGDGERATAKAQGCPGGATGDIPPMEVVPDVDSDSLFGGFPGDDGVARSDVDVGGIGDGDEPNELEEPPDDTHGCGDGETEGVVEDGSDTDAEALLFAFRRPPLPPPPFPAPPTPPAAPPSPTDGSPPPRCTGVGGAHGVPIVARPGDAEPRRAGARLAKAAARGSNWIDIHGLDGAVLRSGDHMVGLSVTCPTCGDSKDLHFVKSGMAEAEAKTRLSIWARECVPGHRHKGGRLLKDCIHGT